MLRRPPMDSDAPMPGLARRYRRPGLREINLGFAGRRRAGHAVHRAISALEPGDALGTRVIDGGRFELLDGKGTAVGRLARRFEAPRGTRCDAASVRAVVTWSRDESDPRHQDGLRCDSWEVVVPELVFEPA